MEYKFIHLLYVPTMNCNMACKYCYLEDNTKDEMTNYKPLDTLKYAIEKFKECNVIPFNISLHGGEVTTLSKEDFYNVIEFISNYYNDNSELIKSNGFSIGSPHIKTNLYNINKHIDTIKKFNVSISGSLDLPFSLHDEFRVTKGNTKTLNTILNNIKLLSELPNKKKVSATIFKEHYNKLDEIIDNIKYLDKNTCLDMNDFNFMIGFDYGSSLLTPLSEDEQVIFFNRMHKEFDNTNLDKGVNGAWFNEFGPEYCTNCNNCGEKFFLLEKNGDIYSCVRGQKQKDYYYGNIYTNTVEEILNTARLKIFSNHSKLPMNKECIECPYLYLCKTGCPFVKNTYNTNKSYTCKLQQELYKSRNYEKDSQKDITLYNYLISMHPDLAPNYIPEEKLSYPSLKQIIDSDPKLKYIYDKDTFILKINDEEYKLESQILKTTREIVYLTDESKIIIYMKENILDAESLYPNNNSLYIILLSGDTIEYGDEGRTKQRHIMSHQIYKDVIKEYKSDKKGFLAFDITNILKLYKNYLSKDYPNNLFFTTNDLRDIHYTKQKNNAYYHFQAINLPFQNIEFYYIDKE